MENKFSANILLCQEITEDNEFKGVFNQLVLEDGRITFDVAIFLTEEINEPKQELFLLDIVYQDGNKYHPLGTTNTKFEKMEWI